MATNMPEEIPVTVDFVAPTTNLTLDYPHKTSENQKDFQKLDTLSNLAKEGSSKRNEDALAPNIDF